MLGERSGRLVYVWASVVVGGAGAAHVHPKEVSLMRRLCIYAALVPSLLVATAPAQAHTNASQRHEARGGAAQQRSMSPRVTRTRTASRTHKYTYGRT